MAYYFFMRAMHATRQVENVRMKCVLMQLVDDCIASGVSIVAGTTQQQLNKREILFGSVAILT
jgi:predicted phosphoribosyltransferase